ncbi:MAG TPA: hypothetical protein VFR31_01940 [Thermoanaerobaculia bacterium]|nr:hypothetical protein [Thermoanaerobaculia bacterium]
MSHLSDDQTMALARRFAAEIRHLEKCPDCRARVRELAVKEDGGYRAALVRAAEDTLRRIPAVRAEKAAAPDLLAELLTLSEVDRETALALDARYHSYALASYVLKRSETEIQRDPVRGRVLARLGRAVAEHVDPRSCGGTASLADLEAYSHALEGEAIRVSGDPEQALRCFTETRLLQERGGADPDLAARIDLLEAVLRRDLGQMRPALDLLDRAAEAFVVLKEHDQLARILLHRASFLRLRKGTKRASAVERGLASPRHYRSH